MAREVLHRFRSRDGYVAVGFALAAAVEAVVRSRDPVYLLINLAGAPLLLVLVCRRSRPLLTISVFSAFATVGALLQAELIPDAPSDAFVPIVALLLAVYSVGVHGSWRTIALAAPQPLLIMLVVDLTQPDEQSLASAVPFFVVFIVAVPIAAGRLVRGRASMIQRLERQGRELEEQEAAYVDAALRRERLRVAGEFHAELTAGMQDLVEAIATLDATPAAADVAMLESQARQLLAETREAVVALAAPPDEAVPASPMPDPEPASGIETGQPWAALSAAALAVGLFVETEGARLHPSSAATVVATCLLLALPLVFAWARPLVAITVLWVVVAVFQHAVAPLADTTSGVGLAFVPPFLVAAVEPPRRAVAGLVVCWLGLLATVGIGPLPGDAALATVCWLAGTGLRQRSKLVAELHANNIRLEQGRAALATQAVDEERMRIARELHDAVGHSLTVVALQAGAARRVWETDPAKARAMLDTARTVAGAGLRELRDGPMAVPDEQAESIQDLLVRARSAGLVVDDTIDDVVAALPPAQLATVYRVVQEAITNVLKHSPGASVTVSVRQAGDDVTVTVTNTAPTTAPVPGQGAGHGLAGMRQRVEQCGGRVEHEPTADGGFVVRARLPLQAVSA